jgi:hypothetical protein
MRNKPVIHLTVPLKDEVQLWEIESALKPGPMKPPTAMNKRQRLRYVFGTFWAQDGGSSEYYHIYPYGS